jgi:large subunit ribosomal protein L13
MTKSKQEEIIINAQGLVCGRLAVVAAKKALQGNKVIVLNSEKAVIIGKKGIVIADYLKKRGLGKGVQKGPHFSSKPDMMLRRMIRGMLPWKRTTGREKFKEIKCFIGVPEAYQSKLNEAIKLEKKEALNSISLEELSKIIKHSVYK